MISMQRSLSSPVCVRTSPRESWIGMLSCSANTCMFCAIAVSPTTTTRPPSRSPTRSPNPSRESRLDPGQRRQHRSRSPVSSAPPPESTSTLPLRRSEDIPRDGTSQPRQGSASASRKPIIAQAHSQSQPQTPAQPSPAPSHDSTNTTIPTIPTRPALKEEPITLLRHQPPLLTDVSQYEFSHITSQDEGTTLEELAHLVRLSKYQERKRASTRIRLQRSLISTALSARLTRCGEITQRNLAEAFRNGESQAFANIYSAIQDVRNSCDATRRYAFLEPELDPLQSSGLQSSENLDTPASASVTSISSASTPFLNELSASAREHILTFLTVLRTDENFLAKRLCSLNHSELQALAVFHQGLEPIESVLPFHSQPSYNQYASGRGSASGAHRHSGLVATPVERLLSFQRHDPLSALIYTCFANSAGPDSAEDRKRTKIWATACARLISSNSPHEHILISVLNVWSVMRDWSGRSNLEFFLMKILEDGAFLLDRAEDPQGTRFNISTWTSKDNIAAEEFYDQAVTELFEIIDDEDATGIPEGVIELGNEILRELGDKNPRLADEYRPWFVYKWLFSSWLQAVVIHPESHGMMAEYNITEYGRQKIFKEVVQRAYGYVHARLWPHEPRPASTPLKIKGHIENIVNRFRPSGSPRNPKLIAARSVASLRETVEVHPYLVISPADLLTMVNALFPERRPPSAHSSSFRSGAPSVSGFSAVSQPISVGTPRSNFDTASVLSMSASSVISDTTTSHEPLLENQPMGSPRRYSPPLSEPDSPRRQLQEGNGHQLRWAMQEMAQVLGSDVVSGLRHPCAERWAVIFVGPDGDSLSLQMTYDPDDDLDDDNSSMTSDTEDDEPSAKPELDKDYHQMRDSILKLVEDFEIPKGLEDPKGGLTFSNRASGQKRYRSKNKIITSEKTMGSKNPYRKQPVLVSMLTAASSQCRVQSDFVSAHLYWKTVQYLNGLTSLTLRKDGFATLLHIFSRGPRDSIRRSASAIEEYDAWLVWLKQSQERHEGLIETMMKRLKAFRDKMWYVSDVRNSDVLEHARNVCKALKTMGLPRKWGTLKASQAEMYKNSALNYLYQAESEMLGLLAASEEHGGPNKLSDDQAEKTTRWLAQTNIDGWCRGEERIHRFCCEIDNCLARLVGDSLTANPVLWSSVLYARERKMCETPRRGRAGDRQSVFSDDAASIVSGDHERRYTSSSARQPSIVSLRNMSSHNMSHISIDSGRHSFSRASTVLSDYDPRDSFGMSSPVHTIDSASTFWSPFQSTMSTASSATSRAQSPTPSARDMSGPFSLPYRQNLPSAQSLARPGTSASSHETIQAQLVTEEKQQFLADLRQTLLSLLLSDLGNLVFARGSETDTWFNDLGQMCIERQDEENAARQVSTRVENATAKGSKQRVLEKKKSLGNLREAGDGKRAGLNLDWRDIPSGASNTSTATNDTIQGRAQSSKKDETAEFPYKKAYQRLLKTFSVHPNPYHKLNAICELEQLIIASLACGGRRSRKIRSNPVPSEESWDSGKAEGPEQGPRERRAAGHQSSLTASLYSRSTGNPETRSIVSMAPTNNTYAIQKVLESLFRDETVRPRTLFRDLQFINAFVPSPILDGDKYNSPYLRVGLAALGLKQDTIAMMVEIADEAVKVSQARSKSGSSQSQIPMSSHSLHDAARMLTIAAKEGDATAQRELGLLHLSNPELVARTTLPLSKPRDVFKQSVMEKFGPRPGSSFGGGASRFAHSDRNSRDGAGMMAHGGPGSSAIGGRASTHGGSSNPRGASTTHSHPADVRSDPALMCVAWHWMEAARNGKDEVAAHFLRQDNEIMGSG
ncbi:hypothetical protein F5Y15DRAFT_31423 [Xylariaceae sp. FL0016]|nr:hypothetical protein F5Y15DRAFT_31423 [Xylariaceae sp. FL0016]